MKGRRDAPLVCGLLVNQDFAWQFGQRYRAMNLVSILTVGMMLPQTGQVTPESNCGVSSMKKDSPIRAYEPGLSENAFVDGGESITLLVGSCSKILSYRFSGEL
jgi:hypothetical protein